MDDDKKRKLRGVLTVLTVLAAALLLGALVGRGTAAENPTCGYVATPDPGPESEPAADGTGSGGLDGDGSGG